MQSFSERIGKTKPKLPQIDAMDIQLRNGIWNTLHEFFFGKQNRTSSPSDPFYKEIWVNHFKLPVDELPDYLSELEDFFKKIILNDEYYYVYDLLEYILQMNILPVRKYQLVDALNKIFIREFAAYRIIDDLITPVINDTEITSIGEALSSSADKYRGVNIHLRTALEKLSDRNTPDYRNSFKESMLAIESICQILTNNPRVTLGSAIKELNKVIQLHPAQEKGFACLYGYSSDSGGIRHAMWDESNIDQTDAKYMLVTASAFINYIIEKSK